MRITKKYTRRRPPEQHTGYTWSQAIGAERGVKDQFMPTPHPSKMETLRPEGHTAQKQQKQDSNLPAQNALFFPLRFPHPRFPERNSQ